MRYFRFVALSFGGLLWGVAAYAQAPTSLYTQAQAQAGGALYQQSCAMCHGNANAGSTLVKSGMNPTIGGIFGIMTSSMPLNQPGSLSQTQYEDILAYALQNNGYPAGAHSLDYHQALSDSRPFVNKPQ